VIVSFLYDSLFPFLHLMQIKEPNNPAPQRDPITANIIAIGDGPLSPEVVSQNSEYGELGEQPLAPVHHAFVTRESEEVQVSWKDVSERIVVGALDIVGAFDTAARPQSVTGTPYAMLRSVAILFNKGYSIF